ncbi:MAG: [FeFe] hydrogenase H-cluster maturation GTPase HydF [Bacillota bacterium]|jgi:[FeFe] hydrogenase H-cluster maturation GTPase HydF|nr:[FeFe] hydrogenase H-cluster maturation GTPase HydF [Bacillota bacterium]NLP22420.1 [FeFe] hydrogenase H-cluster maturation GTPase HydF [Erysipelotrichaceae bacterium]
MSTPRSNRIHIAFFGRRNVGKSSLVNAITNQEISIVSSIKGTTTDPVYKAMELLPLGPVVIIDTPGIDDEGTLGELRVRRTKQILNKSDIAILVIDENGIVEIDQELIDLFDKKEIPYLVVNNKSDIKIVDNANISVSSITKEGIEELKEKIARLVKFEDKQLIGDLLTSDDMVILVTPIDDSAPKGRLILPQVQTIRDILDTNATSIVIKEDKIKETLAKLKEKPKLVITDSQVFNKVSKDVPEDIFLTSFSILMARYKGFLKTAVQGVRSIENLKDGDIVLISEGCTHHKQCDDIGTVKIPRWLREYTKKDFVIETVSGGDFPDDLSRYALIIHCGGCMLNEREVTYRMKCAIDFGVPFTNYGIIIAYMNKILDRSIQIFEDL